MRILSLAVLCEGGLVLLWLILAWLLGYLPESRSGPSAASLAWGAAATLPLLPLLLWMADSRLVSLRRMMREVDDVLVPMLSRLTVGDCAFVALLAGIGEEGLFRGVLQEGLGRSLPGPLAVVAASIAFGLLHFITPAYAVVAGVLGLYLGTLYAVSGSLAVPMTVHALYDFFALIYLLRWRANRSP